MKVQAVVLAGLMALCAGESLAAGWVDTGIVPEWPIARVWTSDPEVPHEGLFFDEPAPVSDVWSPIRIGLGGGKHSTTNWVCSLPWIWTNVYGLQVEILSCACDVYGIQTCLAGASSNVYGLQASLGNYVYGDAYGIQAGIAFTVAKKAVGLQIGGCASMAEEVSGLQFAGLVSGARERALGLQFGVLGAAAYTCDGVQIGLFNFAEKGTVVQIGLWNVYGERGNSRHLPILNVGW